MEHVCALYDIVQEAWNEVLQKKIDYLAVDDQMLELVHRVLLLICYLSLLFGIGLFFYSLIDLPKRVGTYVYS